jgi:dUTP pyrophosphatase
MRVDTVVLPHAGEFGPPRRHTAEAAGVDLIAAIPEDDPVVLNPRQRQLIPTGIALRLPQGYEGQIRPRSGIALTSGITVLNSPGTIDSDYRGEIKVLLINLGAEDFIIRRGDRIAQLVVSPVVFADFLPVQELEASTRSIAGFGSTGI